jgi:hypothetical protein
MARRPDEECLLLQTSPELGRLLDARIDGERSDSELYLSMHSDDLGTLSNGAETWGARRVRLAAPLEVQMSASSNDAMAVHVGCITHALRVDAPAHARVTVCSDRVAAREAPGSMNMKICLTEILHPGSKIVPPSTHVDRPVLSADASHSRLAFTL